MRLLVRLMPWVLLAMSLAFAIATWSQLPVELPLRLHADGSASGLTEKSLLAWFGLPLLALATLGLLTALRAIIPTRPELFNHPEKERLLALPPSFRSPVFVELGTILDVTGLMVVLLIFEVQFFLFSAAMGRPRASSMPIILVSGILIAPTVLMLLSRVNNAVETAERRWIAAGRPRQ